MPACPFAGIAEIYNYEPKKAKASIGYRLDEKYWGRGIATQTVRLPLTAENAAAIPCCQVLGAYRVRFRRYDKRHDRSPLTDDTALQR